MIPFLKWVTTPVDHEEQTVHTEEVHRIGEFVACYEPPSAEEIAQTDAAVEELFKRSKPVPTNR